MFDLSQLFDFVKVDPDHGILQSILLFMIWWQSRRLREDIASLKMSFTKQRTDYEVKFREVETRIDVLKAKKTLGL